MSILSIPPHELLRLWTELEEARHGTNGFGGSTAELIHRFWLFVEPVAPLEVTP